MDAGRTWRGTQRQLLLLSVALRERAVEPLVVAPPRSPLLEACKRAGVATAARTMRGPLDLIAIRGLRRLLGTWHPDIVHAHDPVSHAVALAALVGRRRPIPLVVTRRLATPPRGRAQHRRGVAQFIVITDAVRAALRSAGLPADCITLVHPGVEVPHVTTARAWRSECGWSPSRVVAGVIGPITELSHRETLVQLVGRCTTATRAHLALVLLGGPSSGRCEIAGVPAYRAGFVHDVPAALAGLQLLLHPGGAEGLGTALVEGMALQVPAVAYAAGGVGEIIVDGETGRLVTPGDSAAFAHSIDALVADESRRVALGAAGPARARTFSVRRMVDGTLDVYRAAVPRFGAGTHAG